MFYLPCIYHDQQCKRKRLPRNHRAVGTVCKGIPFILTRRLFAKDKTSAPLDLTDCKIVCSSGQRSKDNYGVFGGSEEKIEMLFIHPAKRGEGIGTLLNNFAVEQLGTNRVDVNEQNEQAVTFYKKLDTRSLAELK